MGVKCPCGTTVETKFCPDCGRVADQCSLHALQIYCREQKKQYVAASELVKDDAPRRVDLLGEAAKWSLWTEKLGAWLLKHGEP
jgi:hypothetical protein